MPIVRVETFVAAPAEKCFDAARDIGLHERTAAGAEKAVAGVMKGLIGPGETVTFEARHFLVKQRLTSKIVQFDRPNSFTDEMQEGAFKRLRHIHKFRPAPGGTLMVDTLDFASPFGPIGWLADLVLRPYLTRFVAKRNRALKAFIESGEVVAASGLEPPT